MSQVSKVGFCYKSIRPSTSLFVFVFLCDLHFPRTAILGKSPEREREVAKCTIHVGHLTCSDRDHSAQQQS